MSAHVPASPYVQNVQTSSKAVNHLKRREPLPRLRQRCTPPYPPPIFYGHVSSFAAFPSWLSHMGVIYILFLFIPWQDGQFVRCRWFCWQPPKANTAYRDTWMSKIQSGDADQLQRTFSVRKQGNVRWTLKRYLHLFLVFLFDIW